MISQLTTGDSGVGPCADYKDRTIVTGGIWIFCILSLLFWKEGGLFLPTPEV